VKGIACLIAAMSMLRDDFPDMRLEIAGDGPEMAGLAQAAMAAGVSDRVTFLGWIDDVESVMSHWDIVAQPSLAEGLGISALQAMALGIPVVASDVGGLREIITNDVTGFLVPPSDAQRLALRIADLARDAGLRQRIGEAARAHAAANFSLERESRAIQSAYERLLA
jgi:glycosyltransferase involved in cell wall biosynthesis